MPPAGRCRARRRQQLRSEPQRTGNWDWTCARGSSGRGRRPRRPISMLHCPGERHGFKRAGFVAARVRRLTGSYSTNSAVGPVQHVEARGPIVSSGCRDGGPFVCPPTYFHVFRLVVSRSGGVTGAGLNTGVFPLTASKSSVKWQLTKTLLTSGASCDL